jgi:hypothetical protein
MSTELDIDVLPIYRQGGYDQPSIPGLHLAIPPRRTARGRASDLLIILFDAKGNAPLTVNQQGHLLSDLSKSYYQHRGSVTASMRTAIEQLNSSLLERNQSTASTGLQTTGLLTMIVAREKSIYLAQSGPMHAFVIAPGDTVHLYNTNNAGRGLGVASTPPIHFYQTSMENGGLILGSPAPPPTWTSNNLKSSYRVRLENLHQGLINQAGPDLTAMVIKVRPGTGELHLLQPTPGRPSEQRPQETAQTAPPAPQKPPTSSLPDTDAPAANETNDQAPRNKAALAAGAVAAAVHTESRRPAVDVDTLAAPTAAPAPAPPIEEAVQPPAEPIRGTPEPVVKQSNPQPASSAGQASKSTQTARRSGIGERLAPALLIVSQTAGSAWSQAAQGFRTLVGRMTPGGGIFTLPSSVMVSVAIIIPLIVVTIAFTTYLRQGLAGQHEIYLDRAAQSAAAAAEITEPNEARDAWEATLNQVATAEAYGSSEAAAGIHSQAQTALDQLDGVTRLAFQPALARPFNANVFITELASTPEDLYMLNGADGAVLRAWLSGRGYEPDATFSCGPGVYGSITVGELIDIASLPKGNEFGATLLALDRNGNLIYCVPGKPPIAAPLVPPDSNWGDPTAIAVDSGRLFVLDPLTNAVWVYRGSNYTFSDRPSLFFTDEIPPLETVFDMAVNRQDLYLLHADGHLTTCTASEVDAAPTRCVDPAIFSDPRFGREPEVAMMPGATFNKIQFTPPPDPSIYLLDPANESAYHFSLRLTFQRQFQPEESVSENVVTALTVSPNRTIFYAEGNEVYYANLP